MGALPDLSMTSLALSWTDTMISNVATSSLLMGLRTNTAPAGSPTDAGSSLNRQQKTQSNSAAGVSPVWKSMPKDSCRPSTGLFPSSFASTEMM